MGTKVAPTYATVVVGYLEDILYVIFDDEYRGWLNKIEDTTIANALYSGRKARKI